VDEVIGRKSIGWLTFPLIFFGCAYSAVAVLILIIAMVNRGSESIVGYVVLPIIIVLGIVAVFLGIRLEKGPKNLIIVNRSMLILPKLRRKIALADIYMFTGSMSTLRWFIRGGFWLKFGTIFIFQKNGVVITQKYIANVMHTADILNEVLRRTTS